MERALAYSEGLNAYGMGVSLWSNPYKLGSDEWCDWEEGWLDRAYPNRDNRMGLYDGFIG